LKLRDFFLGRFYRRPAQKMASQLQSATCIRIVTKGTAMILQDVPLPERKPLRTLRAIENRKFVSSPLAISGQPPRAQAGTAGTVLVKRFIRAGLECRGYSVEEADSFAGASGTSAATSPDLVVLDVGTGNASERDVVRSLRGWPSASLIVLSNASDDEANFLKIGAADHLAKPFGIVELAERCSAALRRSGQRAE
jgi:CheY-like chemotaxis protein